MVYPREEEDMGVKDFQTLQVTTTVGKAMEYDTIDQTTILEGNNFDRHI